MLRWLITLEGRRLCSLYVMDASGDRGVLKMMSFVLDEEETDYFQRFLDHQRPNLDAEAKTTNPKRSSTGLDEKCGWWSLWKLVRSVD